MTMNNKTLLIFTIQDFNNLFVKFSIDKSTKYYFKKDIA